MVDKDPDVAELLERNRKLKSVFHSHIKEVQDLYDSSAPVYEKAVKAVGYVAPVVGAKILFKSLEQHQFRTDCKILDIGSGTGLVGEQLRKLNYTNVDALEPSEKSNDIARSKGIYKNFIEEFLGPDQQLSIGSNTYDAAICIGVFVPMHMKAEGAMDEMVRVVKPGGLICFSIRDDVIFNKQFGHEAKMAQLCESNSWKVLSKTLEPYRHDKKCFMFVYQVLKE